MRLLLLNWRDLSHPRAGGAERYVHEIGRRWVEAGHDVTLFCARPAEAAPVDEQDGIRIIRSGSRLGVYRAATDFLRRTAGRWDAIIESVNTRPFFAHRHARGAPTVSVFYQLARDVWFHEAPLPVAIAGRYILEPRWLHAYRDARVVAISESTARDLRGVGIEVAGIATPGTPVPTGPLPPEESAPLLVFVGRLTPSKRPEDAVRAWQHVRSTVPQVRLSIIGDGPLRPALQRSAAAGMTIHGRVDEATKWALLSRASLLLVPSVREGWGIIVMEAAMAATPAVAYRVPGLVDSIRDGHSGWLCESSPAQMGAAALRALADPQRPQIALNARRWARRFRWDDAAATIMDQIRSLQEVRR